MKRLTKLDDYDNTYIYKSGDYAILIDKLGQLEDIMEEFGIPNARCLRQQLDFNDVDNMANENIRLIQENQDLKKQLENKKKELKKVNLEAQKYFDEIQEIRENAIVPKFKIGQTLYWVYREDIVTFEPKSIVKIEDEEEFIYCYDTHFNIQAKESDLFATEEEATARLKELKGETK